jgi:hypothetical protein
MGEQLLLCLDRGKQTQLESIMSDLVRTTGGSNTSAITRWLVQRYTATTAGNVIIYDRSASW